MKILHLTCVVRSHPYILSLFLHFLFWMVGEAWPLAPLSWFFHHNSNTISRHSWICCSWKYTAFYYDGPRHPCWLPAQLLHCHHSWITTIWFHARQSYSAGNFGTYLLVALPIGLHAQCGQISIFLRFPSKCSWHTGDNTCWRNYTLAQHCHLHPIQCCSIANTANKYSQWFFWFFSLKRRGKYLLPNE